MRRLALAASFVSAVPAVFVSLAAHAEACPHADAERPLQWMALQVGTGKCLDVDAPNATVPGARVQAWDCAGTPNQTWAFDGDHLVSAAGLCLEVHRAEAGLNGARLTVAPCNDNPRQQFAFQDRRILDGAGLCVDVDRPSAAINGARVQVWECAADAPNQRWTGAVPEAFQPAQPAPEPYAPSPEPYAPAPVVYVAPQPAPPQVVYVAPQPAPPQVWSQVDQAFHLVNHAIGTFRNLVDAFVPQRFGRLF